MNGAATQIAAREFDADFLKLPAAIQSRIQLKLDSMGTRLANYPHFRMVNSDSSGCESAITGSSTVSI